MDKEIILLALKALKSNIEVLEIKVGESKEEFSLNELFENGNN